MKFQKGQSGNPSGRPKKGDSLADLIRTEGKDAKLKTVQRMWALASEPHDRPDLAIKAAEWCAKHGWPEESKPDFNLNVAAWKPLFALPAGSRPALTLGDE